MPRSRAIILPRRFGWILLLTVLVAIAAGVTVWAGYRAARADPIVRRVALRMPRWPAGEAPAHVAVLGDLHLGNEAMDGSRLRRIVEIVDALKPDLILITGDMISGRGRRQAIDAAPQLQAVLRGLRAPLGVIAVLGNHDHDTDAPLVTSTLRAAGITVLVNDAVRRGPLVIGGLGDPASGRERIGRTLAAMEPLRGAPIVLAHSPKPIWHLPKDGTLLLAGHTHCGQIVVPVLWQMLATSPDFRCGIVRDRRRTTIVTAGLGTSRLPLRLGAPPDLWLLRLGPDRGLATIGR